ncbi:MAG TPA: adenylosuccinate synthetase, partial [Candidatus Nanoarchaeia archaeon]|nr:adenylosuccinate synthetase [Candidatus Nanoarchaeia archaeon]
MGVVVIGAQWGDEGKGKVVDLLSEHVSVCARFGGGHNAGHTVVLGETKYPLNSIPSGILRPNTICVLGNGMVINPFALNEEIARVGSAGYDVSPKRILISDRAHLIFPIHEYLDREPNSKEIGTTGKGIGPAYADKMNRIGLRFADACSNEFAEQLTKRLEQFNERATVKADVPEICRRVLEALTPLKPYVKKTEVFLYDAWKAGEPILLESAQGTLLDIDHGTYPFVTSSN